MAAKCLALSALLLVLSACSNEPVKGEAGADAAIAPDGLRVTALEGGNGVLELVALTLRDGPSNPELYAALRNVGQTPACHAALSVELFDEAAQSLAAGISGLLTQRLYRLSEAPETIAACVGPGEITIGAVTDLPSELVIEDVRAVVYRCPYFALDVVPTEGLDVRGMKAVAKRGSTTYTGTLVNRLDVTLRRPNVSVFPLNRAGRPLGVASGSGDVEVLPGERWAFETSAVDVVGVEHVAFPAGALGE